MKYIQVANNIKKIMKQVTIDFTHCKTFLDLNDELAQKLDFPDFYGQNLDALWDCLTGFIDLPLDVHFKGIIIELNTTSSFKIC